LYWQEQTSLETAMHKISTLLAAILVAPFVFLPGVAASQTIDGKTACMSIGATWTQHSSPPFIGQCALTRNHTVGFGQTFEVGGGVNVEVQNGAVLANDGVINVLGFGKLSVRHSHLLNRKLLRLNDDASISLVSGSLVNEQNNSRDTVILNEGTIEIDANSKFGLGLYNMARIDNDSSGVIINSGHIIGYNRNAGTRGTLINGARGAIVNRSGSFYLAGNDENSGTFENEWGSGFKSMLAFSVKNGGQLVNSGLMDLLGLLTLERNGLLTNYHGTIRNLAEGTLDVNGQLNVNFGALENHAQGQINVGETGIIETMGRATFFNAQQAVIDNYGIVRLGCFSYWINNGTLNGNFVLKCSGPRPNIPGRPPFTFP